VIIEAHGALCRATLEGAGGDGLGDPVLGRDLQRLRHDYWSI
jgi:hypothetical protein